MPRSPLPYAASIALLVLAASAWMLATAGASALGKIGAAADAFATVPAMLETRAAGLQVSVDGLPAKVLPPVLAAVDRARVDVTQRADAQITAARGDVVSTVKESFTIADARLASIQADARPVLQGSTALLATYNALPAQIGGELRPSWIAIQPEITCRQPDGSGYGGCWHGRITGLMGEALKVGGVFTRNFPVLSDNINGITTDFHAMTTAADRKYFNPPPKTRKQKLLDALENAGFIGLAVLRAAK